MILRRRKIVIATLIAALGGGAWWALEAYSIFGASYFHRPKIDPTPALKPDTHTSTIMIPVAIDLAEIRSALEAAAPRSFKGKRENPIAGPFGKSEIGWVIRRELLALAGQPEGMTVSAGLTGDILVGETLTGSTNDDPISGLIGFIASAFEQRGKMRGQVKLDSRPTLQPNWRIDPKLSGQISIPDGGLTINGFPIEVSGDVKTAIDKAVAEQIEELGKQVGDDKTIETIARGQWDRICKSISLSAISPGNPDMYLQIKPVRAFAAHPVSGEKTATVTLGLEAEARVVATGAQPNCAFPATLEIVPPVDRGRFKIAAPIDLPFSDINAMLDRSLRGRTFPENADAWAQVTVQRARVIPSGDRLLVELIVKAREEATWFGFGARATVYVWVRPKLDTAEQKLRFADMTVDVRSRAAWGLFGAAARLALPYIQEELESNAVIDLKPYVASARSGIEAAVAAFDKQDDGVNASASVTDLRLTDVAFDGTVVRLTVEGEGTAKMEIVKLPDRK
jgi:hypothetical protein